MLIWETPRDFGNHPGSGDFLFNELAGGLVDLLDLEPVRFHRPGFFPPTSAPHDDPSLAAAVAVLSGVLIVPFPSSP